MRSPLSTDLVGLTAWLLLSFVAAAVGGAATVSAGAFYAELTLPAWAPPGWLFGPVWTVLYTMLAFAAWLVWREAPRAGARVALALFCVQLALNAAWSWLFFGLQLGAMAFVDIVLLWLCVVATVATFWRVRPLAAALLVPYLLWISFAAGLSLSLWQRNPLRLG